MSNSLLVYFEDDWKTISGEYQTDNTGFVDGEITDEKDFSFLGTVLGIFYEGSQVENIISERFRAEVSAVHIIDPYDLTQLGISIKDFDRVIINSRAFDVIHPDNIGLIDDSIIVGLKEFK